MLQKTLATTGTLDDPANRRAAPRFTLLIRTAKLVAGELEQLCIVRDVSRTGVRLRLFDTLPPVQAFELELPNGERFAMRPVWARGEQAGFRFDEEVDVDRLIAARRGRYPERRPRLRTLVTGQIGWGEFAADVTFDNLSQQGGGILCEEFLAIGQPVRVEVGTLAPFYAKVRWRRQPHYGLVFERTLSFEELARLVSAAKPDRVAPGEEDQPGTD